MKNIFIFILILISSLTFVSCKNRNASENEDNNQETQHVCTYDSKVEIISASCESGGYMLCTCSCGNTVKTNESSPLGHNRIDYQVDTIPTMESGGSAKVICENGHEDEISLPKLTLNDYTIVAIDGSTPLHCTTPVSALCTYKTPIRDENSESELNIEFISEYLIDHSYTAKHVYSNTKHYLCCTLCSTVNESSAEEHSISSNICTVCGYVEQEMIYSAEKYGLSVSYSANGIAVSIPEYYMDHYLPKEENKIKGIKSFADNTQLRTITIPASIEYIEDFAFDGCTMLEKVYYDGTWDQWCSISFGGKANPMNYAKEFYILNGSSYVALSEITLTNATTSISSRAFEGFRYIGTLTIPKTVTTIGDGSGDVFGSELHVGRIYYCGNVEDWCKVDISSPLSSPTKIADTFYMMNENGEFYSPTELIIPSSIKKIGNYQFYGYKSANTLTFEDSVDEIGVCAFDGCLNLITADFSSGCEIISNRAFAECKYLRTIYLPDTLQVSRDSAFSNCSGIQNVYFNGTIEDWCSLILESAASTPLQANAYRSIETAATLYLYSKSTNEYFSTHAEELVIPKSVTKIGSYQFYGFSNVSKLTLSNDITEIGDMAMAYCHNMSILVIPKSVSFIGKSILKECDAHIEIHFDGTLEEWSKITTGTENSELDFVTVIFEAYGQIPGNEQD